MSRLMLVLGLLIVSCRRPNPGDGGVAVADAAVARLSVSQDAGHETDAGAGPVSDASGERLERLLAFNVAETELAYAQYGELAAMHIIHVMRVATGEIVRTLPIGSPGEIAEARRYTAPFTHRVVPATGAGASLRVLVEGGVLTVGTQEGKTVYRNNPFGPRTPAVPAKARVIGQSPSGRLAIIHATSAPHPEFGRAHAYVVVPVGDSP